MTGQIIFREGGTHPTNGKHLMMIIGVIAIPEGVVKAEHQYAFTGTDDLSVLTIHQVTATDVSAETRGAGLGHLVKLPIWRV
jgi:hypothetical protein